MNRILFYALAWGAILAALVLPTYAGSGPTLIKPSEIRGGTTGRVLSDAGSLGAWTSAPASSGQYLGWNGSALTWSVPSGSGGSPAGSNTQVQYNNSGAFGADAGFTYGGQGGSTLVTLTPTSTSAKGIAFSSPASFIGYFLSWTDSSSNPITQNFFNTATAGANVLQLLGQTSGTNPTGNVRLGYQGYQTTSGGGLGGLLFGDYSSSTWNEGAKIVGYAAESHSSGHLGSDIRIYAAKTGTTSDTNFWLLSANGNTVLNNTGSALSTSATDGFTYIPNSAGSPGGSPTSYTGATPIEYDTTDHILWGYTGSAWQAFNADQVTVMAASGTTSLSNDALIMVPSLSANVTLSIPAASSWPGQRITVKWKVESTAHTVTISPSGGNVEGASTFIFNGSTIEFPSIVLESDGTNWWIVSSH